tara:strand:- start:3748 stop:4173 length:426 start_codon:yes stop_codon:yes gene_type:complete
MALIKKIDYKGNEFNDLHKYEIELEDNGERVIGNIFKKTDNPYFKEGDEVEYTINDKGTLKLNKPGQTPYNQKSTLGYKYQTKDLEPERIARSVSLKVAMEHADRTGKSTKEGLKLAATFEKFILEGEIKSLSNESDKVPF